LANVYKSGKSRIFKGGCVGHIQSQIVLYYIKAA